MQTLIERLRTDFARKTLGELIQEREAAVPDASYWWARSCVAQALCDPKYGSTGGWAR